MTRLTARMFGENLDLVQIVKTFLQLGKHKLGKVPNIVSSLDSGMLPVYIVGSETNLPHQTETSVHVLFIQLLL